MNKEEVKRWAEGHHFSVSTILVDKDGKPLDPNRWTVQELKPFIKEPWWKQVDWVMVSLVVGLVLTLIAAGVLIWYEPKTLGIIGLCAFITFILLGRR